jgi:hypothetical protein
MEAHPKKLKRKIQFIKKSKLKDMYLVKCRLSRKQIFGDEVEDFLEL